MASWIERAGRLDRRAIFVMIALSVIIPLLLKLVFPVFSSQIVRDIYDEIEALPPGSRVLLSLDYSPATAPENQPMASAISRHVLVRDCKLYVMALWPTGPGQANILIEEVLHAEFPEKAKYEDWVQETKRADTLRTPLIPTSSCQVAGNSRPAARRTIAPP